LILTQKRDTLRSEHKELKIKYDVLKKQCSPLKENLYAITEKRWYPDRDRHNLVDAEGRVRIMSEDLSSIQDAQLTLAEERDPFRSEHEKLKFKYDELKRQCSVLKEQHYDLQSASHYLVDPGGRAIMILGELLGIQEDQLILTLERESLRSEDEEMEIKYDELKTQYSALKEKLNAITALFSIEKQTFLGRPGE
jgi:predicted  nucleic acid-binding Zn-ribbon protein